MIPILPNPTTAPAPAPAPPGGRDDLLALTDELLILVHESEQYHARRQVFSAFGDARRSLNTIRRRIERAGGRRVVAVVGLSNVGKSTLLNALLGEEFAPRRNRPCTAIPIEFCHGTGLRVTVYYEQRLDRPCWSFDDPREVQGCLERLNGSNGPALAGDQADRGDTAQSPARQRAGDRRHPGLRRGTGGRVGRDPRGGVEILPERDVTQVFWVVLAEQGIGRREVEFRDRFFAEVCDDLVVTGCEDWDVDDRGRFRRRFSGLLGDRTPTFHFVSGLQGLDARRKADGEALEAAGIAELERRIRELAEPKGWLRLGRARTRPPVGGSVLLAGGASGRARPAARDVVAAG